MTGITAYSTYIPRFVLGRELVAQAWASQPRPGWRAVRNFDEDSLTMATAALASGLASFPEPPDRLYFASTTAPYWQRSSASQAAAACDLPASVHTADFSSSLRSATSALISSLEAVTAGGARCAWTAAADAREPEPESPAELFFGDAAAACAAGRNNVLAELLAWASVSTDFLDEWRRDSDPSVRSFSSRYSTARGFEAHTISAARTCLKRAGLDGARLNWVAMASPDGRSHAGCLKALGSTAHALDPHLDQTGVTGAAMPLLLLARVLDLARAGDLILVTGYGEGADALLFRATPALELLPRPLLPTPRSPLPLPSYALYRKLRAHFHSSQPAAEVSNVLLEREEPQNVRLHASRCPRCAAVQFPPSRVCSVCRDAPAPEPYRLARAGKLFTFTQDFLYDAPRKPTVMAVVDLDGGGRFLCQMTDAAEREVEIGMNVELVFRRLRESPQNHHYYWKCRPR